MNRNDTQFMAQRIRTQYVEREATELDELRALDTKVKKPATIFGYAFGSVSAVIMGAGMSLVMTEIGSIIGMASVAMPVGIAIGVVGLGLSLLTYPIYKKILAARKEKYAAEIIALSDRIIEG